MGLFSRRSRDAQDESSDSHDHEDSRDSRGSSDSSDSGDAAEVGGSIPTEHVEGRPVAEPLTDAERGRIADGLAKLAERGVDVDDLQSIGAGFDAARTRWLANPQGEDAAVIVELLGIAIGEYLVRHSARQWAIVTDVFGTDLGLASSRGDTVIVPHNLIGGRWMRGETGWVPGVVGHLERLAPRRVQ